jgi:hypothetical protein
VAASLVDDVIEALQSHPDPFWARQAAQRVLDEHESDPEEREMCAGYGYVSSTEVALTASEENAMAVSRLLRRKGQEVGRQGPRQGAARHPHAAGGGGVTTAEIVFWTLFSIAGTYWLVLLSSFVAAIWIWWVDGEDL